MDPSVPRGCATDANNDTVPQHQDAARRKLFMRCKEILTDEERKEFASYLLRRDISSFKTLTDEQVGRLLDGLEGWHLIQFLISQRR